MKAATFCLCLALGFTVSLSADAAPPDVHRPTLARGETTPASGAVTVGAEGAEWAIPGGARIVASPGAELRVIGAPQRLALGPKRNTPGYTVVLRSGELQVSVPPGGRSAVVVAAPRKTNVLVVSGSTSIGARSDAVVVANAEGETSVGVNGDSLRALKPGMLRRVDAGAGETRPLAESPANLELAAVVFAFDGDAASPSLRWPAAPGAAGYRLEVRDPSGRLVERRELASTSLAAGAFRLAPGTYSARVAGIDPSGLEAKSPVERSLRVVGVAVPARGFVDVDGALHFPAGQRVELSHSDGVEVTYGAGSYFVPAPRVLDFNSSEPRLVRFRMKGQKNESRLWLVPRKTRARVEFGPALPTWPHDALEIRVRLHEENGARAPLADVEARPKVLVGLEPVPVEFKRDGDSLRGVLSPRAGKGPWVVRVEVEDQSGVSLGRDFIEISQR